MMNGKNHEDEKLNRLVGKRVRVTMKNGARHSGVLEHVYGEDAYRLRVDDFETFVFQKSYVRAVEVIEDGKR